jgi:hypothetical protein
MIRRILSFVYTKKYVGVAILLIIIKAATIKGKAVASINSDNENIKDCFYKSVNYEPNKGLLSFTIPKSVPEGYRFYLHVSGRIFMGDKSNGMSFHVFDKESLNYTWKNGKTYTYPLKPNNLDSVTLDFGLQDKNSKKLLFSYTIRIFPDGTKIIEK